MLGPILKVIKHPVVLGTIILVCISAIVIERALNDLLLDFMNPWAVLGLGILIFGSAFFVVTRVPKFNFGIVLLVGAGLIIYGEFIAGGGV